MSATHASSRATTPRGRGMAGTILRLLIAAALAAAVLTVIHPWVLQADLLPYSLTWMLRPESGFYTLAIALWLLLDVPARLIGWARGSVHPRPGEGAAQDSTAGTASVSGSDVDPEDRTARLAIPGLPFRELGIEHRVEMAHALDIPWRDELIHDHQSWTVACLEAAQRRATDPRR